MGSVGARSSRAAVAPRARLTRPLPLRANAPPSSQGGAKAKTAKKSKSKDGAAPATDADAFKTPRRTIRRTRSNTQVADWSKTVGSAHPLASRAVSVLGEEEEDGADGAP
jgi:hypothetical protein